MTVADCSPGAIVATVDGGLYRVGSLCWSTRSQGSKALQAIAGTAANVHVRDELREIHHRIWLLIGEVDGAIGPAQR